MSAGPPDEPLQPFGDDVGFALNRVVDLAGVRLRRGRTKPGVRECPHMNLTYSDTERRVWCDDCSRTIDNFDALMVVTRHFEQMMAAARRHETRAREAMEASLVSRAAKKVDEAWRGRGLVPACPHCHRGLLPEDFADGAALISREMETARRRKGKS
jgi:hypothetical protein